MFVSRPLWNRIKKILFQSMKIIEAKYLYTEHFKILMKEIRENIDKWKDSHFMDLNN